MTGRLPGDQAFWDDFAKYDPLWAILSNPTKAGRQWDLPRFLETGRREISLLFYQLRALGSPSTGAPPSTSGAASDGSASRWPRISSGSSASTSRLR